MNERHMQRMKASREELAERIAGSIHDDGFVVPVEGLRLNRGSQPTTRVHGVSRPSLCIIAQGAKEVYLGDGSYLYNPDHYLLATVELPVTGRVIEATPERPYLSLRLDLDPAVVGS